MTEERMKPDQLERFDTITATFQPLRTDDLKPWVKPWVGVSARWCAAWEIEEGQFAGDWAMTCMEIKPDLPPFGWVPLCDLVKDET